MPAFFSVRYEMPDGVRGMRQFGFEKFRINLLVRVQGDPNQVLFAAVLREALADRRKSIRYLHVEVKGNFIDQLAAIGSRIPIEIVLVDKAEPVNFHPNAGFLPYLPDDGFFRRFPKFQSSAHGIEIVPGVADHQQSSALPDDGRGTDVQHPLVTGHAHIFFHGPLLFPFQYFTVRKYGTGE